MPHFLNGDCDLTLKGHRDGFGQDFGMDRRILRIGDFEKFGEFRAEDRENSEKSSVL